MTNRLGYKKINQFLTEDTLSLINSEILEIFKKPTINFSNGYIKIHPHTKAIPFPFIYIRSTNLIEIAIDVYDKIIESGLSNDSSALSLAALGFS